MPHGIICKVLAVALETDFGHSLAAALGRCNRLHLAHGTVHFCNALSPPWQRRGRREFALVAVLKDNQVLLL